MENDSQNFQTLYCAWTLHGWREHKWEKKNERKKREVRLYKPRKGTNPFICFLECLEHLVLLATRNHFCRAKGFTHELKPKVFSWHCRKKKTLLYSLVNYRQKLVCRPAW